MSDCKLLITSDRNKTNRIPVSLFMEHAGKVTGKHLTPSQTHDLIEILQEALKHLESQSVMTHWEID